MCTVTVIPARTVADGAGGAATPLRVVVNRDELRTRPPALPPERVRLGDRGAVMPIDPRSRGTWVAASDAGLIACLLNASPAGASVGGILNAITADPPASRGEIIPRILTAPDIRSALKLTAAIDPVRYPPFRLLVLDAQSVFTAASDGARITLAPTAVLAGPLMVTSSGLGDHLVESPRRALYDHLLAEHADPLDAQARFHTDHAPGRAHLSVLMSRPDARTVSKTLLDLHRSYTVMRYIAIDDALSPEPEPPPLHLSFVRDEVAA